MGLGYRRTDLRANAQAKLDDAIILFQAGRFSNAYYLVGYAVEIGLRACIAAQIRTETIPDKDLMKNFLQHEFTILIGLSGLRAQLSGQKDRDPDFAANWAIVSEWSPDARYEAHDPTSAQTIMAAINDPQSGVPTMDQNALVSSGHALVKALDDAGMPPRIAMWVHNTDTDTWKLWIVPPAGFEDKHEFYRRISEIVSKNRAAVGGFDASDTETVLDTHPAMRGIGRYLRMRGLGSIHFSGNMFNGYYLPDGIILRSDL